MLLFIFLLESQSWWFASDVTMGYFYWTILGGEADAYLNAYVNTGSTLMDGGSETRVYTEALAVRSYCGLESWCLSEIKTVCSPSIPKTYICTETIQFYLIVLLCMEVTGLFLYLLVTIMQWTKCSIVSAFLTLRRLIDWIRLLQKLRHVSITLHRRQA